MGSPVIWFGTKGKVLASGGLVDVNGLPIGGSLPVSNKNTAFTATAGNSYLVDTSSTAITVTLPAGAAHATMRFYDAAGYWSSNNIILTPATGEKFRGLVANDTLVGDVNAAWIELVWDVTNSQWQYATNGFSIGSGGGSSSAGGLVPTYKVANFTAATNFNYLVNTTSAGITATLPAGATGATIRFTDDAGTWKQNNLTITPATGEKFQGQTANDTLVCDLANGWVELNWDATNSQWTVSSNGVAASTYTGPIVTDWVGYTPTITNLTVSAVSGKWRRVGDSMEGAVQFTSSAAASSSIFVSIPSGLTIDSTKVGGTVNNMPLGVVTLNRSGGNYYTGNVIYRDSTNVAAITNNTGSEWSGAVPVAGGSGDFLQWRFSVPITEWASQNNIAYQNDVEWGYTSGTWDADDSTTAFGYTGATISGALTDTRVKTITFANPVQATDKLELEIQVGGSGDWVPMIGATDYGVLNSAVQPLWFVNGTSSTNQAGVSLSRVSGSPTVKVIFGKSPSGYFNGAAWATNAWSTFTAGSKWRVRKSSGGQVVGFGIVVPGTSAGLVSANGLTGNVTGNAIASGYVGEVISSRNTSVAVGTGLTQVAAVTLTPGVWNMAASAMLISAGAGSNVVMAISTATASSAGAALGYSYMQGPVAGGYSAGVIPMYVVTLSASTTYYLNMSDSVAGTFAVSLTAVRIA